MKKSILLLAVIAVFLSSCSPRITTSILKSVAPVSNNEEVKIYNLQSQIPENATKIGRIDVGDSGFTTNCGYDAMLNVLLQEARKVGANAICITDHIKPNPLGSSCHQFSALAYNVAPQPEQIATTNNDTLPNGIILAKELKDTIQFAKNGIGYSYTYKGERLTLTQLETFFNKNTQSFALYQSAKSTSGFAGVLGYIGGFFVGYGLGTMIYRPDVGLKMTGIGCGILVVAIPIISSAENKLKKAVQSYNMDTKNTSLTTPKQQIQLTTVQNGVGIAFTF
ncbi:MAG: hypothetical protein ACOYM7_07375 [Paludibacter sp.]